jgi:hypothetical protein
MTLRRTRRFLWTLCGALALAVVVTGAGLVAWPLEGPGDGTAASPTAGGNPITGTTRERLSLSAYACLWEKDLQRPLYDPAPAVAKPKPPPVPGVTLVGTVIEEGFTYALLKTKAGQVKMVSVGQTVEGAQVLVITANSTTIRLGGHEHVLKIEKETKGS